jgi:hypothetical protein
MPYDRVKETTTSTGTTAVTLGGAATGYVTVSSVLANGQSEEYCIAGGSEWEVGRGHYVTSGNTFARDVVYSSSNSGSLVSFSAGTKNVFITVSAKTIARLNGITGITAAQTMGGF